MSTDIQKTARPSILFNIQVLRAFAALSVVFGHTACLPGLDLGLCFGGFGVDIFFVISGFIICYITSFDSHQFLKKRLIRIVPFYWVATLLLFLVAMTFPLILNHTTADTTILLHSLFFIPHDTAHGPVPLLLLGWSLNFEMYFYVVYWLALKLSDRFAPLICSAVILAVMATLDIVSPHSMAQAFYGRTIVLEFVFGMGLFQLYRISSRYMKNLNPGGVIFWLLIATMLLAVLALPVQEVLLPDRMRVLYAGIPAAAIVLSALLLEKHYRFAFRGTLALLVGEASYVLYLMHPYVIYGGLRVAFRDARKWPGFEQFGLIFVLVALAVIIAVLVHLYFERPIMAFLRRRLLHVPPPVAFEVGEAAIGTGETIV